MLEESGKDKELNISSILDKITKLTRLLMIETNNKGAEAHLKKIDYDLEEFGEEGYDTTVWVTDKEKFTKYEPDDDVLNKSEEEINEYIEDINKSKRENAGFRNSHPATVQDISDKPEEIQKIFKNTLVRLDPESESLQKVKCDNNVTMKAIDMKPQNSEQ
ncbi:MAG: hypothetical protein JST55_02145 [Bacteroidetes bacterium]|nr:hypothetical protein [Bacteroidota bacterium]